MEAQKLANQNLPESSLPKWNLSSLFENESQAKTAVAVLHKTAKGFADMYKGKIENAEVLLKAVQSYEKIYEGLKKVQSFAYLYYITHMEDEGRIKFYHFATENSAMISTHLAFFSIEINTLPEQIVKDKILTTYTTFLQEILNFKPHLLPEEIEKTLLKKSSTSSLAWRNFHDSVVVRLQFAFEGKNAELSQILNTFLDSDSKKRHEAAMSLSKTLGENVETFAFIMNTLIKDKEIEDQMRGFKKPISERNLSNCIEDEIVDSLISSVKKRYGHTSHRYYKLKAKIFGQEKLNYWDRNAPMPFHLQKEYSFNEAKTITLEAYNEFSPRMARIGNSFFEKNWIDAPAYKGKGSGAFMMPTTPNTNPFIMVNFLGNARCVSTLAHELGHGIHQFLSNKQSILMCEAPLTFAEIASVFGEKLVFEKMLKTAQTKEERLAMLAGKIEDTINTCVTQIAYCEFERQLHEKRKAGTISTEEICQTWLNVNIEAMGDGVDYSSQKHKYSWAYIGHFIDYPFYVYAYSFADILVNSLYKIYKSNTVENFQEKYIELLSAGGSLRHKELLAPFNIDISTEEFWLNGIAILEEMIEEFENEYYAK